MAGIDIERVRAETPACAELIHFNNAGASLPPQPVVDAMVEFVQFEARLGGYEAVNARPEQLDEVYAAGAEMLGAQPTEIAYTGSASEAWWRAFSAVPLEPGDRVLTGRAEYVANAFGLIQARRRGIDVEIIGDDAHGQIDLEALEEAIDERVALVALTHVPTSSGLINPAAEVGALARSAGAYYLLDACQSAGQLPLDVDELQCDFLSLTGRKFLRGPRGTGLLYVRSSVLDDLRDPVFIDGWSADWVAPWDYELLPGSRRYELFEANFAAKAGFGVALRYALDIGLEAIAERVQLLATTLRDGLEALDGVTVHDPGLRRCGIVTFTVAGHDCAEVQARLSERRINTTVGRVGAAQLDLGHRGIDETVRASVHYFNTDDEVATVLEAVAAL